MLTVRRRPNGVPALVNVFEDFFNRNFPERFMEEKGEFIPSVNVSETEKEFKLEFAVPGFDKKDFNVETEKEFITISGSKETIKETGNTGEKNYTRKEFSYGSFKRTFTLPENVDSEKIEAVYENGVLNLILPKREVKPENNLKKIEIK